MCPVIFPPTCVVCGVLGVSLCSGCASKMRSVERNWCIRCGNMVQKTTLDCLSCKGKKEVFGVFAFWFYEATLSRIVQAIKYGGEKSLILELVSFLPPDTLSELLALISTIKQPILVPVPLHRRREKERGFNQSLVFARALSVLTKIPLCSDAVIRTKETPPQALTTSRLERNKNMVGAFEVVKPLILHKKTAIVVDDIVTTGSTTRELLRKIQRHSNTGNIVICMGREEPTT